MTNLEAKQEAIKKAYDEYWEKVKDYVDENGWIKDGQYHKEQPIDFEIMEVDWEYINDDFLSIIRPKSLQGIEKNNGWIKIESEADLPKNDDDY